MPTVRSVVLTVLAVLAVFLSVAGASTAAAAEAGPLSLDLADDCPSLRVGDTGPCVRTLQEHLVELGGAVAIDGYFGTETEAGVARFQGSFGQEATGVADEMAREAIVSQVETQRRIAEYDPNAGPGAICEEVGSIPVIGDVLDSPCSTLLETEPAG